MPRLFITADDFTGALDTGVQFSKQGIPTQIALRWNAEFETLDPRIQVVVTDLETRHLPAERAAELVRSQMRAACAAGVPYLYKKTDSALRGNIGAELAAASEGAESPLCFIPALPGQGRTTRLGIQYIKGIPVSESEFGIDPFEPVSCSGVEEIIRLQSDIPVSSCWPCEKGVAILDAETERDLAEIAAQFKRTGVPRVMAGCAGFAAYLPELLGLTACLIPESQPFSRLLVLSGSVNPVTLRQQECAAKGGYEAAELTPELKLTANAWESAAGANFLAELEHRFEPVQRMLCMASSTREAVEQADAYAIARGLDSEQARRRIAENLGELGARLAYRYPETAVFIIGGDTLRAFLDAMRAFAITPLEEPIPGVVLSAMHCPGGSFPLISKSGGFSNETVILELEKRIQNRFYTTEKRGDTICSYHPTASAFRESFTAEAARSAK